MIDEERKKWRKREKESNRQREAEKRKGKMAWSEFRGNERYRKRELSQKQRHEQIGLNEENRFRLMDIYVWVESKGRRSLSSGHLPCHGTAGGGEETGGGQMRATWGYYIADCCLVDDERERTLGE